MLGGDCRAVLTTLPPGSVQCCVTSPPYYGLRDYGVAGQIGLEPTPDEYVAQMVAVFREVRRVLADDGTCWLNIGDSYANGGRSSRAPDRKSAGREMSARPADGCKPKDLLMIPARVAMALQADGWWLRSDIIWHKPNPMPESVTDRPTSAHEHVFLLTKRDRYFYDAGAIAELADDRNGAPLQFSTRRAIGSGVQPHGNELDPTKGIRGTTRNARNVWTITPKPFSGWTEVSELVPVPASEVPGHGASDSALGGDMARITSPDCPTHAGQSDRVPRGFCDGLSDAQLRSIRGNDCHPAQRTVFGCATTPRIPAGSNSRPSTNDCSPHGDAETATLNNTRSHKRDRDLLSSERAISFGQTSSDRPHTEPSPSALASNDQSTVASKSGIGSSALLVHQKVAGSARRSLSPCHCGYYRKVTTKTSHFATMPPELAERCIRAGSRIGDTILDPFGGAGTTGLVAGRLGRNAVLIDLNVEYTGIIHKRLAADGPLFATAAAE